MIGAHAVLKTVASTPDEGELARADILAAHATSSSLSASGLFGSYPTARIQDASHLKCRETRMGERGHGWIRSHRAEEGYVSGWIDMDEL